MTQDDTHDTRSGGNTKTPDLKTNSRLRSRRWCFTLNNYTDDETKSILEQVKDTDTKYILGFEVGDQGTPHIQGYMEFKNARSFASMKKMIPRAHLEKAKGNTKQNYTSDRDWET